MNKKRYTVKWIAVLMQAVCLFFVFSGAAYAGPPLPTPYQQCYKKCTGGGVGSPTFCEHICKLAPGEALKCFNTPKTATDKHPVISCLGHIGVHGKNIVRYMLIPLQFLISYVAYIMAFFFLAWGLYRLRHAHEGGGANRQASGVGSALCFFAAALLFQYQYAVKLVGTSFLGAPTWDTTSGGVWNFTSSGDKAGTPSTLPMDPPNLFGYFNIKDCDRNNTTKACAALADNGKQNNINTGIGILADGSGAHLNNHNEFDTLETLFATLMIIGFISFVRGAMLIVKAGEGTMQAGESTGTKAVTHILAGGLLCNANHVASVINNMVNQVNTP